MRMFGYNDSSSTGSGNKMDNIDVKVFLKLINEVFFHIKFFET